MGTGKYDEKPMKPKEDLSQLIRGVGNRCG